MSRGSCWSSSFIGKTIVVTGAGSGIGKEVARKLVGCGASVIAVSLLKEELDQLTEELPNVTAIAVDISDWNATRQALQNLTVVHGLVNSAGIGLFSTFLKATENELDRLFGVNVKGLTNVSQIVAQSMLDNGIKGSIINISSVSGLRAAYGLASYSASKGAVDALTRTMALELGRRGIRVNAVNPAFVRTPLTEEFFSNTTRLMTQVQERIPLKMFPTAKEVADNVIYLLSDQAAMINGVSLPIDGGYSAC